ncbi:MAG: hypothetical protein BGO78_08330 [Chloroflexi bacterium 44-23]|nr:MAG: hypothetical protein BGO78_08330 [Chloroflexi bacterium 44-23]
MTKSPADAFYHRTDKNEHRRAFEPHCLASFGQKGTINTNYYENPEISLVERIQTIAKRSLHLII